MKRTLRILLPLWTLFFVTDFQSAVFANETETNEAGELSGRLTAAGSKADTFPETSCFCGVGRGSVEDSEKVAN